MIKYFTFTFSIMTMDNYIHTHNHTYHPHSPSLTLNSHQPFKHYKLLNSHNHTNVHTPRTLIHRSSTNKLLKLPHTHTHTHTHIHYTLAHT